MIRSVCLFLSLTACSLWGESIAVRLDPAHTEVAFTLGATLHTVEGTFKLKSGELTFDPATGKASGDLVVDAASGQTGNGSRDKKMHEVVLESAKYPEIVFHPDRVEGKVDPAGHSQVQLHGMLNIHGTNHEMTVPLTVDAENGGYRATATFSVPYVKWGMKNPSTFMLRVKDTVEITVKTVAR
jgi:polyisoprenoid-binding protein YceI